jgi:segregation and condensation protein A
VAESERSSLSRPPLNVLIDPSIAARRSPWEINLSELLEIFLRAITTKDLIDLRAAGAAALSSATIYRLKVETLFLFERLRAERRAINASEPPQMVVMPFRYEVYSTDIAELFGELSRILEQIVAEGASSATSPLPVAELPPPDLGDYVISLTTLFSEFRVILLQRLRPTGKALLSELLNGLKPVDAARVFLLVLFSAHSGELVINQEENAEDALVVSVGQLA